MIYSLLIHLCEDQSLLRSGCPFNVDNLFHDKQDLTIEEKRWFCVFKDLLRYLIVKLHIENTKEGLLIFGVNYSSLTEEDLIEILERNIPKQSHYLRFVYQRIDLHATLEIIVNQLNENEIIKLVENAKS